MTSHHHHLGDAQLLKALQQLNSKFGRGNVTEYRFHLDGAHELTRYVRGASGGTFYETARFSLRPAKTGTTVCFAGRKQTVKHQRPFNISTHV
jgi:hypothetical protein